MSESQVDKRTPPYASYRSFHNFLEGLRQHQLPSRIDKSVMSHLNYGTQQALIAALKSLKLIEDDGRPTSRFNFLMEHATGSVDYKAIFGHMIGDTYPYLFDGSIDLGRVTASELDEAFKKAAGVKGSTIDKVVSFFVAAAASAGLALSPHLAKRKPIGTANGKKSRAKPRASRKEDAEMPPLSDPPPRSPNQEASLVGRLVGKFPEFDPKWPDDIKAKWFQGFERLMGSVDPKTSS